MKNIDFYNKQNKLSTFAFIYELPKIIILAISLLKTKSSLVLLEIIHCVNDAINSLITFSLCKVFIKNKNIKKTRRQKLEIIISVVCDFMIITGLSAFIYLSLHKLNGYTAHHDLNLVIILTIVSIFCDIYFLRKQKELVKQSNNILAKTELSTAIEDIIFDIIELVSLIIAESRFAYITPALCIVIAIYAIFESIERIREQYLLYMSF